MFCGGAVFETVYEYNEWAKNKTLARDVIVHSHITPTTDADNPILVILVFFDERMHPDWVTKDDIQA